MNPIIRALIAGLFVSATVAIWTVVFIRITLAFAGLDYNTDAANFAVFIATIAGTLSGGVAAIHANQ